LFICFGRYHSVHSVTYYDTASLDQKLYCYIKYCGVLDVLNMKMTLIGPNNVSKWRLLSELGYIQRRCGGFVRGDFRVLAPPVRTLRLGTSGE